MTGVTIERGAGRSLLSYGQPLLVTATVAVVGGLVAWALGWGSGAYFAIAVLAASAGGWIVTRRMLTESRGARSEADSLVPMPTGARGQSMSIATDENQVLVALVGHSRSGKTEIAQWVANHHPDWAWASCGGFVLAEAKQQGVPDGHREMTDKLGNELVSQLGPEVFAERVLASAEIPAGSRLLLVDDIYHESVWKALAQNRTPITVQVKSLEPDLTEESFLDREAARLLSDVHPALQITGTGRGSEESGRELIEKVEANLA